MNKLNNYKKPPTPLEIRTMAKKKRGRPVSAIDKKATRSVFLEETIWQAYQDAAKLEGLALTEWIRRAMRDRYDKQVGEGIKRTIELKPLPKKP